MSSVMQAKTDSVRYGMWYGMCYGMWREHEWSNTLIIELREKCGTTDYSG